MLIQSSLGPRIQVSQPTSLVLFHFTVWKMCAEIARTTKTYRDVVEYSETGARDTSF